MSSLQTATDSTQAFNSLALEHMHVTHYTQNILKNLALIVFTINFKLTVLLGNSPDALLITVHVSTMFPGLHSLDLELVHETTSACLQQPQQQQNSDAGEHFHTKFWPNQWLNNKLVTYWINFDQNFCDLIDSLMLSRCVVQNKGDSRIDSERKSWTKSNRAYRALLSVVLARLD